MKKYRYTFHLISGHGHVVTSLRQIDMPVITTRAWVFFNDQDSSSFCNEGGVAINVNNIEFIEVEIIDEK